MSRPTDGLVKILDPTVKKETQLSVEEFSNIFSSYVIIKKRANDREKEQRSGHWFFSAFRKSKWIYVQVMIAAMVRLISYRLQRPYSQ